MNYFKIDARIEQLNLQWREYDFGDTLYAKIPTDILIAAIEIDVNFETPKYKVWFQSDNNALIFKEMQQLSFVTKIVAMTSRINRTLSKQEREFVRPKSPSTEASDRF